MAMKQRKEWREGREEGRGCDEAKGGVGGGSLTEGVRSDLRHLLDIFDGGPAVAHLLVDLLLQLAQLLRVVYERVGRPGERGGGGLVAGDEQSDQVVAHLLRVHLLASQIDEEAEHRGVFHVVVILVLERLKLLEGRIEKI